MGRLAIMPRPRAGDWLEDEAVSWRRQGLDIVVSLLEDGEVAELGLDAESELCERAGLRFIQFPIPDRGVPSSTQAVSELVSTLFMELRAGRGVGIHCRIGVGRSASLAVCVLATSGVPVETGWSMVKQARGLSVPDTPAQRAWVAEWFAGLSPAATRHVEPNAAPDLSGEVVRRTGE
ncbi:phosphatase domain-containing putative toxin [Zavarzinella formosa]|uniref:phosphatase domain-containing putative toxin n=1 Tax=Zavarzinella formosa TaxID=360055 RepID=UPI0012F78339|nr:dual specificity protein phosphatase family protein [Zavarzinella formosa]